jgi:hypothetical protein
MEEPPPMDYLRWFRHRLAHRLGSNFGRIVNATDDRGQVWIGFECALCGEVNGARVARLADGRRPSDPSVSVDQRPVRDILP